MNSRYYYHQNHVDRVDIISNKKPTLLIESMSLTIKIENYYVDGDVMITNKEPTLLVQSTLLLIRNLSE